MKLCYVETSHDQEDKISYLSKSCESNNFELELIVTNDKLKKIYFQHVKTIHVIKPDSSELSFCSLRAYFMEKNSRFWGQELRCFSKKQVENLINKIRPDFFLAFVGPEAIKYMIQSLSKTMNYKFYFLDQIQNGYKTLCKLPYSVDGDIFDDSKNSVKHSPFFLRKPKKILHPLKLFNYSKLRFFEALASTFTRKLKSLIFKYTLNWIEPSNDQSVVLAPQGYTEAAFSYGTFSFKTPVEQLYDYTLNNKKFDYRWRLHPIWYTRITWSDFKTIYKSNFPIEKPGFALHESMKKCKFVVSLNSNIIFDANVLGTPSISIGKSVFKKNNKNNNQLVDKEINKFNSKTGLGYKEWNQECFNQMVKRLKFIKNN